MRLTSLRTIAAISCVAAASVGNLGITTAVAQEVTTATTMAPSTLQQFAHTAGTTQTVYVYGYGKVTSSYDESTGIITTTLPDGSVTQQKIEDIARALQTQLANATPEQRAMLVISAQDRISKADVCPYLVTAFGTLHTLSWAEVLTLAAVNPAVAALAALGEGLFWTWVGTHC